MAGAGPHTQRMEQQLLEHIMQLCETREEVGTTHPAWRTLHEEMAKCTAVHPCVAATGRETLTMSH